MFQLWDIFLLHGKGLATRPMIRSPKVHRSDHVETPTEVLRLPVVAHGAEFLVQGFLMRRNILTYKAPPNNEGYDLICINPDPRKVTKQIRVQVKSRYATDCNRTVLVKGAHLMRLIF